MTKERFLLLIGKYLSDEATEEERKEVEQWYESLDGTPVDFPVESVGENSESASRSWLAVKNKMETMPQALPQTPPRLSLRRSYRWIAAAAVITAILAAGYLFKAARQEAIPASVAPTKGGILVHGDLPPGGNKAVLTLGNGRQIVLNSADNGLLSTQGKTKVIKINKGLLTYRGASVNVVKAGEVSYNTVATPRGGFFEIVLPDGSKAWLNALSSIRFPTAFIGKERKVSITGEVYFEVAQNVSRPFEVSAGEMTITVLGTHFNIMAYQDESMVKATLLQGSVSVNAGKRSVLLKPGWQADLSQDGKVKLVKNSNVDEAVAWKNGVFWFQDDDVQSVMRQLSRWYDVDIDIVGEINDRFTGSIPRNINFSKVFELLQRTGSIHYKVENSRIIVSP
jgi:ferric-dicitrate binding protein FerR (iron transport regulator)